MNQKKAKQLRKLAKNMVTNDKGINPTQFYIEKQKDGSVKETLIPMPVEWPKGTFRQAYQALK